MNNVDCRPSKVTRPIEAAKAKGTKKMSEAMINENKEQRDMQLEYQRKRQLEQVRIEIEEDRNMQLKDKWQRESQ